MSTQFFRVSAQWMKASGYGDEAKVFPVICTEADLDSCEYDILVLERNGERWPVFRIRGRMVPPYTLILREGYFHSAIADCEEPPGTIKLNCEFHILRDAMDEAERLNAAIKKVRDADAICFELPAKDRRRNKSSTT